jgi:glutamate/tyrosine decarboxylase-like PLP-dependent enzyme
VQIRDRLAREFNLAQPPHIHADAVIGWIWAVFRDYDFNANPLGFRARTLRSLQDSLERLENIGLADSLGVDFHKTGYAPYISSAFLVRNRDELTLLSREPEEMPYLYQFGRYHPGIYTLECSRPGSGPLAALANMQLLGKQGFRILIGHVVEMAEMLREQLEASPMVEVLNDYNYGPVTLFRVYPDGVDADVVFQQELTDSGYRDQLLEHNRYNREIFQRVHQKAMQGAGVLLSWTDAYRYADYDGGEGPPVAALKSYILSPWTDRAAIAQVVNQIMAARQEVQNAI